MDTSLGRGDPAILPRDRLRARLDDLLTRRLAVIVAGAGYGKSTLVASWLADRPAAWVRLDAGTTTMTGIAGRTIRAITRALPDLPPELLASAEHATSHERVAGSGEHAGDPLAQADAVAAILGEVLEARVGTDLVIVFDDLHELAGAESALRFVAGLIRGAPVGVRLVVTSRRPVPFPIERLRGQALVVELGAEQLRFDDTEVEALLDRLDPPATDLAAELQQRTQGWPALVRLVIESLRDVPAPDRRAALARMVEPGGRLLAYVTEEVLEREPEETLAVLRVAGQFEHVDADLLAAIGVPDAAAVIDDLARRAFLLEERWDGPVRSCRLHGLVGDSIRTRLPMDESEVRVLRELAASWLADHGRVAEAVEQRLLLGDPAALRTVLETHADALLAEGALSAIVDGVRAVPPDQRPMALEVALGDALVRRGEWDEAAAAFRRASPAADGPLPAALAWRIGLLQHERGDAVEALATFERADLETGTPADAALVGAWRATAHWMRLETEQARPWAAMAMTTADRSGDDRARAAALAAVGAVASLDGDTAGAEDRFREAVAAAERAGDLLIGARFRADLGYLLTLEGRYADGLAALDGAVRLAGALGHSTILALSLTDRGLAHLGLGHLEEAEADLEAGRERYERIGSRWAAYPIMRLANLARIRGETAAARRLYQEARPLAERLGPCWFYPEILNGLAFTYLDEDPVEAVALATAASDFVKDSEPAAAAHLNAARVALAAGARDLAVEWATRATAMAEARRDRPSEAGTLELAAQLTDDPARAQVLLDQAEVIWAATGSPFGRFRHDVLRARLLGGPDGVTRARAAAAGYRAIGAWSLAEDAELVADRLAAEDRPAVEIQALGTFRVVRAGTPVGVGEWQSRKARDILKILVARRGRAITREQLCEWLWPDEDPGPLLNRLSVALAIVRTVLDPDRVHPADHFVRGDKTAVALDLDHVEVDLERFLAAANEVRRGGAIPTSETASRAMAQAEDAYGGDFLAEDPDAPWAIDLREEARVAYLEIARTLAVRAAASGDTDGAVRRYLRILEPDPYDEDAHLGLVRALAGGGRHGEARRRYGIYAARMSELGLEPAAYPSRESGAPRLVA
jgi:DNA-binding SARP family transcriptional activator